ncbi:MAG: folylpolyglutamate synthase/dihydrofolate synthase family protein [Bacteroidota bacterium]
MSNLAEHLRFLYNLQFFGIKLGLRNIRSLLTFLDHPERKFPSIHVAGTNGKGSTAAMIASMLTASGYRTGLYTSPHLVNFMERIRIDGEAIPPEIVSEYTQFLQPSIRRLEATFFEATTAIAFQYFAEQEVDVAVVETGLGGRLDATNVVTPLVSVITNIGIEHTEHLGRTHARIAFEKGGIIKPAVPCFTDTTDPAALRTLERIARSTRSQLYRSREVSSASIRHQSLLGTVVDLKTEHACYRNLSVSLAGAHQVRNAQLAVLSTEYLKSTEGFTGISASKINEGLSDIQRFTGLRGRLDVLRMRPIVIADVAHNPDGIVTLVRSLKELRVHQVATVFGAMKDKDYNQMTAELLPISRCVVAVQPRTERALDGSRIVKAVHARRSKALLGKSVENGLNLAMNEVHEGEPVLVVGSHYVVGEAMQVLGIQP